MSVISEGHSPNQPAQADYLGAGCIEACYESVDGKQMTIDFKSI